MASSSDHPEVHDPCLFSAPPFTGPCRHASLIDVLLIDSPTRSTHASLCSAVLFGPVGFMMFFHAWQCMSLFTGCRGSGKANKEQKGVLSVLFAPGGSDAKAAQKNQP
jgi:hypothetical protein